jgi:hypothetical protein
MKECDEFVLFILAFTFMNVIGAVISVKVPPTLRIPIF